MPIYEYRCNQCGFEKDHLQKMNAAPLTSCPACGADAYVKLVSAAGFQLKGSGWYATDFKNNGAPPAASTGKSKSTAATPAASPSTESTSSAPAASAAASPAAGCAGSCACHPG